LAPKKKLKEFFKDLQADQKVMVAELCADHKNMLQNKFELVKLVDVVAAVHV
jgi:hypothetical protein